MTQRERVFAALARAPGGRPPVAFWRHAPDVDHTAKGLADAMLAFHRRYDLDLIKVMSSGVYCVEDWGCRVAYTGSPRGEQECPPPAPGAILPALEAIPETTARYALAALDAGADGIFFATQTATAEFLTEAEVARFEL